MVDAPGNPTVVYLTSGGTHGVAGTGELRPQLTAATLIADCGCDAGDRVPAPLRGLYAARHRRAHCFLPPEAVAR